jgi:hypothetical protein
MRSLRVVEDEVGIQAGYQLGNRRILADIYVLILQAARILCSIAYAMRRAQPCCTGHETFDEDIVERTAAAIHADADAGCFQTVGERLGGELRALIGVEDRGAAEALYLTPLSKPRNDEIKVDEKQQQLIH